MEQKWLPRRSKKTKMNTLKYRNQNELKFEEKLSKIAQSNFYFSELTCFLKTH